MMLCTQLHQISGGGGGGVGWGGRGLYNGLYGEAPPERGTFFRLQVYKRVGISQIKVYKRVGNRSFRYCRFSHDLTKIKTTKLLILPIYYFNDV